jgi:excinuclease ABC subunit B
MYADRMTKSMQRTIDETLRRRSIQIAHNEEHGFVPTALNKSIDKILESTKVADGDPALRLSKYERNTIAQKAADSSDFYGAAEDLEKQIMSTKKAMEKAAKELDFLEAARLRDAMNLLISNRKK